jgi:hypothetical protein
MAKEKPITASCGCRVTKVPARHRKAWQCEFEKNGPICHEHPVVNIGPESSVEGQVLCHTHLMAHAILCGHPTEHAMAVAPSAEPWLQQLRAMSLEELIDFMKWAGGQV